MINEAIVVVFEVRCNVYRLQISTDSDPEVQKSMRIHFTRILFCAFPGMQLHVLRFLLVDIHKFYTDK